MICSGLTPVGRPRNLKLVPNLELAVSSATPLFTTGTPDATSTMAASTARRRMIEVSARRGEPWHGVTRPPLASGGPTAQTPSRLVHSGNLLAIPA